MNGVSMAVSNDDPENALAWAEAYICVATDDPRLKEK